MPHVYVDMRLSHKLIPCSLLFFSQFVPAETIALPNQSADAAQSFAVATFKPNKTGGPPIIRPTLDGILATNVTFHMLIANAYENGQIDHEPSWANSERYDVNAKLDEADAGVLIKLDSVARAHRLSVLLKALLVERCKLRVHTQSKDVPAYALVPLKSGARLKAGTPDPEFPRGAIRMTRGQVEARNAPLSRLAEVLTAQLGCPVLDRSGLSGGFDFVLQWDAADGELSPNLSEGQTSVPSVEDPSAAILAALQRELGLKLEPTKTPADSVIVDHLEKPTEN